MRHLEGVGQISTLTAKCAEKRTRAATAPAARTLRGGAEERLSNAGLHAADALVRDSSEHRTRSTARAKAKKPARSVKAAQVADLRGSQDARRRAGFSAVLSGGAQPNPGPESPT